MLAENMKNKMTIIHLLGDGLISSSLIEIVFDELLAFRFSLLFESRLSGIGFFESNEIVKFSSIFFCFDSKLSRHLRNFRSLKKITQIDSFRRLKSFAHKLSFIKLFVDMTFESFVPT